MPKDRLAAPCLSLHLPSRRPLRPTPRSNRSQSRRVPVADVCRVDRRNLHSDADPAPPDSTPGHARRRHRVLLRVLPGVAADSIDHPADVGDAGGVHSNAAVRRRWSRDRVLPARAALGDVAGLRMGGWVGWVWWARSVKARRREPVTSVASALRRKLHVALEDRLAVEILRDRETKVLEHGRCDIDDPRRRCIRLRIGDQHARSDGVVVRPMIA